MTLKNLTKKELIDLVVKNQIQFQKIIDKHAQTNEGLTFEIEKLKKEKDSISFQNSFLKGQIIGKYYEDY